MLRFPCNKSIIRAIFQYRDVYRDPLNRKNKTNVALFLNVNRNVQCGLPRCLECHPCTAPLSASRYVAARSGLVVLAFNVKALCRGDYKTANLCWHFFLSGVVVQFTVCVLTTMWQCVRCAKKTKALASLAHSSTHQHNCLRKRPRV